MTGTISLWWGLWPLKQKQWSVVSMWCLNPHSLRTLSELEGQARCLSSSVCADFLYERKTTELFYFHHFYCYICYLTCKWWMGVCSCVQIYVWVCMCLCMWACMYVCMNVYARDWFWVSSSITLHHVSNRVSHRTYCWLSTLTDQPNFRYGC